MESEARWRSQAKRLIRTEMVRRGVTYGGLSRLLAEIGVHDSPANLRNKVSRGKFTTAFLLQVAHVVGTDMIRLSDA